MGEDNLASTKWHLILSSVFLFWFLAVYNGSFFNINPGVLIPILIPFYLGVLSPDRLEPGGSAIHRSWFHSWLIFFMLASLMFWLAPMASMTIDKSPFPMAPNLPLFLNQTATLSILSFLVTFIPLMIIAFILGYLTHLFVDGTSNMGLPFVSGYFNDKRYWFTTVEWKIPYRIYLVISFIITLWLSISIWASGTTGPLLFLMQSLILVLMIRSARLFAHNTPL